MTTAATRAEIVIVGAKFCCELSGVGLWVGGCVGEFEGMKFVDGEGDTVIVGVGLGDGV